MTEQQKFEVTEELYALENQKESMNSIALVRACKALLSKVQAMPRWEDSRSAIGAKFLNLIHDSSSYKPFLVYVDITARIRALLAWSAQKLTPAEAQAEGVMGLRQMSSEAVEAHLTTTQRLSRPGGEILEVARETPEPLVDEAVRRGTQVKEVAAEAYKEAEPIGQRFISELDSRGITNPLLGISCLAMLVFMKNKMLSALLCIALILVLKNRQISTLRNLV